MCLTIVVCETTPSKYEGMGEEERNEGRDDGSGSRNFEKGVQKSLLPLKTTTMVYIRLIFGLIFFFNRGENRKEKKR